MGNTNIKENEINNDILKLINLYNNQSLFFHNSKNSFSELFKQVYIKDLNIHNKKLKNLNFSLISFNL